MAHRVVAAIQDTDGILWQQRHQLFHLRQRDLSRRGLGRDPLFTQGIGPTAWRRWQSDLVNKAKSGQVLRPRVINQREE